MEQRTQFCLFGLVFFLFYCSLCEPKKLSDYEFPVYTTDICPRNETEWIQRSSAINCTKSNSYICIPNENRTELLEFCYIYPTIWANKGVCLYLIKRYSRVDSYKCNRFEYGCPNVTYKATQLILYPSCTSLGNGCFLAESTCESTTKTYPKETYREWSDSSTIIYKETTKHIHVPNELSNDRFIEILLGAVICILVLSFSIILYICRRRRNFSKGKNEIDIENAHDDLNSLREKPKLYKVDTSKKAVPLFDNSYYQQNTVVEEGMAIPLLDNSYNQQHTVAEEEMAVPLLDNLHNQQNTVTEEDMALRLENAVFDQWREGDTFFFSTRACKEVETKIKNQNLVIVTGHSRSGKSAIIQHIALKFKDQGWIVKPFKDVMEMIKYILEPECYLNSTLLVLNDPIGKDTFDKSSYLYWEEPEQAILTFLKQGKILISCRNYILFDDKVKGVLQEKTNIVDIEDGRYKLSNEEKRSIWNKYLSNANISEENFTEILNIEAYFPLLCKLFSCEINQNDGYRFFKEPVKVVEEQIRCFRKKDKGKYCALVLLVLFNNNFCSDDVVRNKLLSYKFKCALTMCGLPQDTPPYDISDNLDLLKGFFVKNIGDAYEFYHDFVMEVTCFILGKDYPAKLTQYADIRFLLRRVTLNNGSEQNRPFTIYLSDKNINILGERFFKAFFEECYIEVILHPALRDKRLIEVLQKKFERHPKKLQELLQTKKCMYDDHKRYWPITDDTMLKLAFVALENVFSPLCALVAFCHSELSVYCFKSLYQSKTDSIGTYLISAVCCNGSKGFLEMFSDESIKDSLTETFGGLFPIHITALFYNFDILQELINLGADVNMKTKNEKSWTPLMFAASRYDTDPQNNKYNMDTSIRRDQTVQMLIDNVADVNLCAGDGVSSLYLACQNGHTSMVKILLSNGAYINKCTRNGESPLFVACQERHNDIVQFLLEKGADINSRTADYEFSPLYIACRNGHDSAVETLLDHGAEVNLCTSSGASPLFIACQKGYNSSVQLLIGKGAAVNMCKKNGASPLYIACQNGHISTVKLLLSNKADVNLCRKDKTSPLFIACQNGNKNLVQLLLDNGADINICDEYGASPLLIACQKGYNKIVQLLLTTGANINLCTLEGFSPLVIACQNGHEETVRTLLKHGAEVNLCTSSGASPLFIACQKGYNIFVQLLIDKGAVVNMCMYYGASPLYIACENDHISTVKLLLSNKADVNLGRKDKTSPLFIACQNGNENLVQLLLDNGADSNICDEDGASPLLIACQKGYNKIVQLLLTNGANINLCTLKGDSPLFLACQNEHEETVRTLLKHGAEVNLCTSSEVSPLFITCQKGYNISAQLLIDEGAVVNMCMYNGASPLYVACENDHISTVKLLLSNKADVNLGRKDKTSPLFIACQNGNENVVQLLLDNGADSNICDEDGASPLLKACQKGYNEIVQLLLTTGANINVCTLGFSPLVIACENGHEETVRTLLKHGADLNLRTSSGASPLFIACQKGYNISAQLLIDEGAVVNMCKKNGDSPLYIACHNDHISTVELLLSNKADANLGRKDKTSPLFIACQNGNENLVQLLLDNGADSNICDEDGASPLLIACQKGYDKIVQLLLTNSANINLCTLEGFSPLFLACEYGHEETVQTLLENGANIKLRTIKGTAEDIALKYGHEIIVQMLKGTILQKK